MLGNRSSHKADKRLISKEIEQSTQFAESICPLMVNAHTGLNDNLNGVENPSALPQKTVAKWKLSNL